MHHLAHIKDLIKGLYVLIIIMSSEYVRKRLKAREGEKREIESVSHDLSFFVTHFLSERERREKERKREREARP